MKKILKLMSILLIFTSSAYAADIKMGVEIDSTRYGLTYYSDLEGDADSDLVFLYVGITF